MTEKSPVRIVAVDLQRDFGEEGGTDYRPRPCVDFIKTTLLPFLGQRDIKLAEIISDYRSPQPGAEYHCCVPGTPGFESLIPSARKLKSCWIKSMTSPVWVRENGGVADAAPGLPYPDPAAFQTWVNEVLGPSDAVEAVVLIGLSLDCCLLCVAQELSFRAYRVFYLVEGVDTYSGCSKEKEMVLNSVARFWARALSWEELQQRLP